MLKKMFKRNFIFILVLSLMVGALPQTAMANNIGEINKYNKLIHERAKSNFYTEQYVDIEPEKTPFDLIYKNHILGDIGVEERNIGPQFIVIGLYKYEYSLSYEGQYYWPNQPFETLTNSTSGPIKVDDTFSSTARVKKSGTLGYETGAESKLKAEYGFEYDYEKTFSRKVQLTLQSKKTLKLFIDYQKILITEREYVLDGSAPGGYRFNRTRTQTVYKPTGVIYMD